MCLLILRKVAASTCSMNIETAAIVFAVFNFLAQCVFSCTSLMLFLALLFHWSPELDSYVEYFGLENDKSLLVFLNLAFSTFCFLLFSVILLYGLLKRNATQVKVYFIFGVTVAILSLIAVFTFTALVSFPNYKDVSHLIKVSSIIVLCLYTLILIMIRDTYKKFETEAAEVKMFVVGQVYTKLINEGIIINKFNEKNASEKF